MQTVSLIIPAVREANRIGVSLERLSEYLVAQHYGKVKVLVAAADSPEGTVDVARSKVDLFKHFRVIEIDLPHNQNMYVLKEGQVYLVEIPLEHQIESEREVFEVPDRFLR